MKQNNNDERYSPRSLLWLRAIISEMKKLDKKQKADIDGMIIRMNILASQRLSTDEIIALPHTDK